MCRICCIKSVRNLSPCLIKRGKDNFVPHFHRLPRSIFSPDYYFGKVVSLYHVGTENTLSVITLYSYPPANT